MTDLQRIKLLEKLLEDLTVRVNTLEYASMKYASTPGFTPGTLPSPWPGGLPVTCDSQPNMGYAQ